MAKQNNDDDDLFIVGSSDARALVAGSVKFPCFRCRASVWIAPSGQPYVQQDVAGRAQVLCLECSEPEFRSGKAKITPHPNQSAVLRELLDVQLHRSRN